MGRTQLPEICNSGLLISEDLTSYKFDYSEFSYS